MHYWPNRDRLSVLTAVIVLAYALSRFLSEAEGLSAGPWLLPVLVAALISTGADALIRSHPRFRGGPTVVHWIVPGVMALGLGAALEQLPDGPLWWLGLAVSAIALIAVLVAEYVVVEATDPNRTAAAWLLGGLVYALALMLFWLAQTAVNEASAAGVTGLAALALAWRLFVLGWVAPGQAAVAAGIVGLISAQAVWLASYWPVPASSAALLSLLPFYLSTGLLQQHLHGHLTGRVWIEYGAVGLVALALILVFGPA
ncbi:MAG: hypothetical protein RMK99_09540 [Anaerolineales bacterium]|nr:hypothetical protein [Anaerolineales bacterium]